MGTHPIFESDFDCLTEMVDTNEVESHLIDRYEIRRRLGKGAYGIVWKANERKTGRVVALKKIFDAFRNATDAQRTFREILFLQEFADHQNIIKLLNVVAAKNDKDIYLVFEYMDTDLHAVIRKGGILQDAHQRYIMAQLLRATAYLHSGNVIHRDHKPSNILLDSDCLVKICDFGLARSLGQLPKAGTGPDSTVPALTEYVATRWYRAPEILLSSPHYTKGVDMWSLGCILAEMLLGKPLFPGDSTFDQIEKIIRVIQQPSQADIDIIGSQYAQTVVERAHRKQRSRSIEESMPAGAPVDGIDLIKKLLVFNPEKRPAAENCLKHSYVARFNSKKDNLKVGYNVVPPVNDDIQLSVDEYRTRLYAMIQDRKREQKEERLRKDLEKASGDHKDHNDTLMDNNNTTLTEDNYERADQVRSDKHHHHQRQQQQQQSKVLKSRSSKSAQQNAAAAKDAATRNKSAPAHRQAQNHTSQTNLIQPSNQTYQPRQYSSAGNITREITRGQSYQNTRSATATTSQMRKTEHKMSDLSVTGHNASTTSNYQTRQRAATAAQQQQQHQTTQQRPQRRYNTGVHKNNASAGVAKTTIGSTHSQQYGTVSAQWLREHC